MPLLKDQQFVLSKLPYNKMENVLDVGAGGGNQAKFFVGKGLKVTATVFSVEFVNLDKRIDWVKTDICSLPFTDNSFDLVWCSCVLEHTLNVGLALSELRRVLKDKGLLVVIVPPYKSQIVGGHYTTGWNLGQLMYILLVNGFNIKRGKFIKHKYNICGLVRKSDLKLPALNYNKTDLEKLKDHFPIRIKHAFEGNIERINW